MTDKKVQEYRLKCHKNAEQTGLENEGLHSD